MKIIFLDIDGVLNPLHYERSLFKMWKSSNGLIKSKDEFGCLFFDQNVKALNHIIDYTDDVKIVISSTWRLNGFGSMLWMWRGRALPGEIYDVTPVLKNETEFTRGKEINLWLERNLKTEVSSYVIIDDNNDFMDHQKTKFVKTNSYYGLTMEDAENAIQILNNN